MLASTRSNVCTWSLYLCVCILAAGCTPTPPKPDFVFELKNAGFCPDDSTRTRIRDRITKGLSEVTDKDVKTFLAAVVIEDTVKESIGQCPQEGCSCDGNSYRLGLWRNNLDGTGAFVATSDQRISALKNVPDFVPPNHTFAVFVDRRFYDDVVNFKWNALPKRYADSGKAAADGSTELTDLSVSYPDAASSSHSTLTLDLHGVLHKFNDPIFNIQLADTVANTGAEPTPPTLPNKLICSTDKSYDVDTSLLDYMSEFFIPFFLEREFNDPSSLSELIGIPAQFNKQLAKLALGPLCASVNVLPTEIPLPANVFGIADAVDFNYEEPCLLGTVPQPGSNPCVGLDPAPGLLVAGEIALRPRSPSLSIAYAWKFPDGTDGWTPFHWSEGEWFDETVGAYAYGARSVAVNVSAIVEDMRDPTVTWSLLPTTWPGPMTTATGDLVNMKFDIDADALPGDTGYAYLWAEAVDSDGLVANANVPIRAQILNCCDDDMFRVYFNQICAAKVGVNRERCHDVLPTDPN